MNRLSNYSDDYGEVYDYSEYDGTFNGKLLQIPRSDANRVGIERVYPDEVVGFEFLSAAYGSYDEWVRNCHTELSRPGLYEGFVL